MAYCVYCHTNKINGKRYVGITKQKPELRWRNGKGYLGQIFYSAIEKYGWEEFQHEVLFTGLSRKDAEAKEIELIEKWSTQDSRYGYNASSGGESGNCGAACSEHRKRLMSERMKGSKNPMFGKKGGMSGKKLTTEQKLKISKGNRGKKRSEQDIIKMRKRASKRVLCSDGRIFSSRKECALALSCHIDSVIKHIKSGKPFKGLVLKNYD